jgi:hypothetical protein
VDAKAYLRLANDASTVAIYNTGDMTAHMHDIALAGLGFFAATAAASSLPLVRLGAALRSRTIAYRANRATAAA